MKHQVLTMEQMKHLKKLGVDTSKSSMCWVRESGGEDYMVTAHDEFCYEMSCLDPVPTFTLQDMLEMMPPNLYVKKDQILLKYEHSIDYMTRMCLTTASGVSFCLYGDTNYKHKGIWVLSEFRGDTTLEASYNMLCWLAKNNLLGKEKKG